MRANKYYASATGVGFLMGLTAGMGMTLVSLLCAVAVGALFVKGWYADEAAK